ncbi:MAG TPA: DUF1365 domain-containing protein [Streptosporangiaceae bacterium]
MYECRITHVRTAPVRNEFTYRSYQWLVDLDQLPRPGLVLGVLAGFSARDHLGDPDRSIRANLDHFLSGHGIDLHGGQVLMLAHARVLGYVFNPLTVYWCHDPDGTLRCVVAEVHNTYGQRHAYLLHTDDRGRAQTPKAFYVSPFYPVDGGYRMSLPEPGPRLRLSVVLERPDGTSFVASVQGRRQPASRRGLLRAAARHPWSTLAVSARIRIQGIRLYLRGLPIVPRPEHPGCPVARGPSTPSTLSAPPAPSSPARVPGPGRSNDQHH